MSAALAWAARPGSHRRLLIDMVRGFAMTARDGVLGASLAAKGRAVDAAIVERDREAFARSIDALVLLAERGVLGSAKVERPGPERWTAERMAEAASPALASLAGRDFAFVLLVVPVNGDNCVTSANVDDVNMLGMLAAYVEGRAKHAKGQS